jgi:3-phenylpropionate/trans-cinnamate dioxygenase ferredoxin subunit
MRERHVIGVASDFPPGSVRIVEVRGRSVGVFNIDGDLYALRNVCPHRGAELCLGRVSHAVSASAPGEYESDRSVPMLRCPWHGWEFDMRTGRSWVDPRRVRVRNYPVRREPGPYTAEAYHVQRDDELVIIELGR